MNGEKCVYYICSSYISTQENDHYEFQYWTDSRVTFRFFLCTIKYTIKEEDKRNENKFGEENHDD